MLTLRVHPQSHLPCTEHVMLGDSPRGFAVAGLPTPARSISRGNAMAAIPPKLRHGVTAASADRSQARCDQSGRTRVSRCNSQANGTVTTKVTKKSITIDPV